METQKIQEILGLLATSQENTSPIVLSIGTVTEDRQVLHGCIVIKECPATTIDMLKSHKEISMNMENEGLLLEVY